MEDFYLDRSHVPAFGNWDHHDYDLPFTQCFGAVTNPEVLLRYSYCEEEEEEEEEEESDLYVAGDLYENDVVTPAMIVVPRHPKAKKTTLYPREKKGGGGGGEWVVCDYESYQVKEPPSPVSFSPNHSPPSRIVPKAVDEDLYKISPDLIGPKFNKMIGIMNKLIELRKPKYCIPIV
ncbi:hypothetical protein Leryth_000798 [Lithospermum erythrorhizon]|nr:hypothetical protein Leryth_000798 [Lithospermum erythrorhizon]